MKTKTMMHKAFRITLILGLVLCLMGPGIVPASGACAGQCCTPYESQGPQHGQRAKVQVQPMGCCCGDQQAPSGSSPCCSSEEENDRPVFTLSQGQNPDPTGMALSATVILAACDFSNTFASKAWAFGTDPPVPLYLLNLSLLC